MYNEYTYDISQTFTNLNISNENIKQISRHKKNIYNEF